MSQGHGIIINYTSWSPFVFTYNPESLDSVKKINYATTPNIGGAYKKRYFSGFETKEISFNLVCIDMESPTGVMNEMAFFEALREPDPGPFAVAGLNSNANYPPPQVLFQFGQSFVPLVWDVLDINIKEHHFHDGIVRGVVGIPKAIDIEISLALDEGHVLNQANQIAKKANLYAASITSVSKEILNRSKGTRKEMPGIFTKSGGHSPRSW